MRRSIEELFQAISNPFTIEDHITRVSSDIVSCGPAFFSYLLQRFIDAAVRETEITKHQAVQLTSEMVIGLGKLLESELYTLPTLQEKVCVKGGVTGEGISVMEAEIGEVFEHLFQRTHRKYNEDLREVKEQFERYE
jgi:competence protein ComER